MFQRQLSNSSHPLRGLLSKLVGCRTGSGTLFVHAISVHVNHRQAVTLHTNLGDIKLEVYCEEVPRTAENFLALAASGYYNDTLFHRNIRGFMIQGGDPSGGGAGTGKGGRSIFPTANGKFPDEIVESLKHSRRGIVSMANSGPNTNGSQFFIIYKAQPSLNGKYTVFAHVIDGMDVLDKMEKVPTGASDKPVRDIRLESITIHANPLAG